jgi:hypothetical protein
VTLEVSAPEQYWPTVSASEFPAHVLLASAAPLDTLICTVNAANSWPHPVMSGGEMKI